MRVSRTLLSATLVAMLLIAMASVTAAIPPEMSYQVMLTDDSDNPLVEENVEIVFDLYDTESRGRALWTETHNVQTNSIGVVSVILGSGTPLPVTQFEDQLWIEITVDGHTLSPRRPLSSAPYAINAINALGLGGEAADDYLLDVEAGIPGVINTPGNPLEWTKLKNVPAGIADGVDDVGGSGDGHSLDASDGTPPDALYVDAGGDVGIGTTSPNYELHLHRDGGSLNYIQFTNGSTGTTDNDGFMIGTNGMGEVYIRQQEHENLNFQTTQSTRGRFTADGTFQLGTPLSNGDFELYRNGSNTAVVTAGAMAYGGDIRVLDDAGNLAAHIEADDAGTGGRMWVGRDDTPAYHEGIDINGNWGGSGQPALRINGTSQHAWFTLDQTGDDSVMLPQDAIGAAEIEDEVGGTAANSNGGISLTDSYGSLTSTTITTPTSGYVLVIGTMQANITHTTGTSSRMISAVSESADGASPDLDVETEIDDAIDSGAFKFTVTSHAIFHAAAGANTYYLVARELDGSWIIYDWQLSAIFIPTEYGTIEDPPDPVVRAATDESLPAAGGLQRPTDIAAERAASEAANRERIERELAEIRARLVELENEMNG